MILLIDNNNDDNKIMIFNITFYNINIIKIIYTIFKTINIKD